MKIIKLLTITILFSVVININLNSVNAQNNIYNDIKVEKVTDELYLQINNQLDDLDSIIDEIDNKIKLARQMKEYEKYPAIRLDIDTPYFGIAHITESKLVIHKGVSTFDVANGYSIRDIVRKEKVKIATFDIAGIVILTRDLNIDKNMTLEDAKTVTIELIKYYEQAVNTFNILDKNLNKTFEGYLSVEKNNLISEYKEKVNIQENIINNINDKISNVLLFTDVSNLREDINKINKELLNNKKTAYNLLLSEDEYKQNIEVIIEQIEENKKNEENVSKYLDEKLKNVKLDQIIVNTINNLNNEIKYIEDYIVKSKTTILEDDIETVKTNYKLASENLYEEIKRVVDKLKNIEQNLYKEYEDIKIEILKNTNEESNIDIYNYNENENIQKYIDDINNVVLEFYLKQKKYIIDNIQINVKNIKANTNLNVYEYDSLKYMYYDMQIDLDNILNHYDDNILIKSIYNKDKLKEVLENVINASYKLLKQ